MTNFEVQPDAPASPAHDNTDASDVDPNEAEIGEISGGEGKADTDDSDVAATDVDPAEDLDEAEQTDAAAAETEQKVEGIPEFEKLDAIATEIEDIDAVLKNMDKDNADFDAACAAAEADGTIADRPAIDTYWQTKSQSTS